MKRARAARAFSERGCVAHLDKTKITNDPTFLEPIRVLGLHITVSYPTRMKPSEGGGDGCQGAYDIFQSRVGAKRVSGGLCDRHCQPSPFSTTSLGDLEIHDRQDPRDSFFGQMPLRRRLALEPPPRLAVWVAVTENLDRNIADDRGIGGPNICVAARADVRLELIGTDPVTDSQRHVSIQGPVVARPDTETRTRPI
jgi:hypothetical protein